MTYYVLFDCDQYSENYLMQGGMPYITYITTTKEAMYDYIIGNYDFEPEDFPDFDELYDWISQNVDDAELVIDVYKF